MIRCDFLDQFQFTTMLWKKESNQSNALYVNIFAVDPMQAQWHVTHEVRRAEIDFSPLMKSNTVATKKRKEGNVYFDQSDFVHAIERYNESLCYAENGSEHLALAYANRAACFVKLKFYKEALEDIASSKEAGYPAHLIPKLDRRKADCERMMHEEGSRSREHEAKLSFEADEQFPCMANVLKVERCSTSGNYSIVAREDIDVGQTVVVEGTTKLLHQHYGSNCNVCLKEICNLIPCQKCAIAMFCSPECQGNLLHESECGLRINSDILVNNESMYALRSILKAIHLFPSADELINFVEETLATDELPDSLLNNRSKYRAFLKQRIGRKFIDIVVLGTHAYCVYTEILKIPVVKQMFTAEKHRRFLMHLIGHHCQVLHHNLIAPKSTSKTNIPGYATNYSYVGVMSRYFNHSCYPHVLTLADGVANSVYVTIRPIKKGEEVFTATLPFIIALKRQNRQRKLWEYRQFRCNCKRCQGVFAPKKLRNRLANDDLMKALTAVSDGRRIDKDSVQQQIGILHELLQKYGHIGWCDEIEDLLELYSILFYLQWTLVA